MKETEDGHVRRKVTLKTMEWDDVKPTQEDWEKHNEWIEDIRAMDDIHRKVNGWTEERLNNKKPTIQMPIDHMASRVMNSLIQFEIYKEEFIKKYGDEGYWEETFVKSYGYSWKLKGSNKWHNHVREGNESLHRFYAGTGNWTGD